MKPFIKISGILILVILFFIIVPVRATAQQPSISYQVFYDQLSPYGQWVDYPSYGYVWLPDAGPDFFPYSSGGQWIMTNYGWTWASDYDWGWAPFHYGRWDYDNYYGWFWVPDNIWGPAWVTWRRTRGYYGWTPMGPGMDINMSFAGGYNNYNNHWIFMRERYFGRSNFNRHYASQNDYEMLFMNSTVINNTYIDDSRNVTYISGPAKEDVQQVTGRRVSSYDIRENDSPGQSLTNREFSTYKPQVIKNPENEPRSAPVIVRKIDEVREPAEINTRDQQGNVNPVNRAERVQNQDAAAIQNAADQQNAVDNQNAVYRRNAQERQDAVDKQNALNRKNAIKRQDVVNQQNTDNIKREKQQDAVNRQNAINRQSAVDQQNAVNRQNALDQQKAVDRQNNVNRQNAVDQQNAVKRQNAVNQRNEAKDESASQQTNVRKTNTSRRSIR